MVRSERSLAGKGRVVRHVVFLLLQVVLQMIEQMWVKSP